MTKVKRFRYSKEIIQFAILLYRSGLTYRDVQSRMQISGVKVSYKTVYEWVQKFSRSVKTTKDLERDSIEENSVLIKGKERVSIFIRNKAGTVVDMSVFNRKPREK